MVSAGDFKNGLTLEIEAGQVFQILEFQHVKPGKGEIGRASCRERVSSPV